jgi:hypothetical protein
MSSCLAIRRVPGRPNAGRQAAVALGPASRRCVSAPSGRAGLAGRRWPGDTARARTIVRFVSLRSPSWTDRVSRPPQGRGCLKTRAVEARDGGRSMRCSAQSRRAWAVLVYNQRSFWRGAEVHQQPTAEAVVVCRDVGGIAPESGTTPENYSETLPSLAAAATPILAIVQRKLTILSANNYCIN